MRKFVCSICGFVYDEATGIPEAEIREPLSYIFRAILTAISNRVGGI